MTQADLLDTVRNDPVAMGSPFATTLSRVVKYGAVKGVTLFLTVIVGLYLTIIVVNLGGHIDDMYRGMIFESVTGRLASGWLADESPEVRTEIAEQTVREMEEARGLDMPFLLRSGYILLSSLTLDFGGGAVKDVILTALPYTAILVGLTNLIIFVASIILAVALSHRQGSLINRLISGLSPLTFAPGWVHGVILITIFAGWLTILPWPDTTAVLEARLTYRPVPLELTSRTLRYMILPALAIFIGTFFQGVYAWRSFFRTFKNEDYVELAKAKGLPASCIERRYIFRPLLPYVITSFAILAIVLWQEAIALELLFGWPGIGLLFILSAQGLNTPILIGIVVVFAYMLAITVFFLDILYALIDPRLQVGGEGNTLKGRAARPVRWQSGKKLLTWFRNLLADPESSEVAKKPDLHSPPQHSLRDKGDGLKTTVSFSSTFHGFWKRLISPKPTMREILRSPSAVVGLVGIIFLICVGIYTVTNVPVEKAIAYWRGQGDDWYHNAWYRNPVNVPPAWINWFRKDKLPPTIILDSQERGSLKETSVLSEEMTQILVPFSFNYHYTAFPSQVTLYFTSRYQQKSPLVALSWRTPDGREIDLGSFIVKPHTAYYLSTDESLQRKLGDQPPAVALFTDPASESGAALKGTYELTMKAFVFEPDSDIEIEAVFYGQVHGLAGTDPSRRDPMMALMWGTTFALAFGLFGAVCTSLAAMVLAAVGVWYSGWVDGLIQRITEVNLILPKLLIAILIYFVYSKSIWVILGVLVILNIFGSAIKSYRALFLQVKEAPYVEAARAFGASNWWIIRSYLVPPVLPILIPQIVLLIPGYVFYEATLAYLGVKDPYLPTWGKIIYDALSRNALLDGHWYQVLVPIGLLSLTGLAFALFGNALERILNPNLREV
jgi:peptide/nickel transport system permease protein